jgi:hypothetical protein
VTTDTTEQAKSFLGVPVHGDIQHGTKRANQRPITELQPLFQAVLDDPLITSFGWHQYTPYFNDGEPCVFGVRAPWFRTAHDTDPDSDYDLEVNGYSTHPTLGGVERESTGTYPNRLVTSETYKGEHEATFRTCLAMSEAIAGGEFETVLLEAFGDHARVVVSRDGIDVEFYEHD